MKNNNQNKTPNAHLPVSEKAREALNGNGRQNTKVAVNSKQLPAVMSPAGSEFIKKYICTKAQPQDLKEIQVQLLAKNYTFKDVIRGRANVLPFWDGDIKRNRYAIVESIHQLMAKADATGNLDGIEETSDATVDKKPTYAEVTVWRKGCSHPFKAKVWFKEFARYKQNGQLMSQWNNKSDFMLRKCARAAALRLAFPEALMNSYIFEEFGIESPTVVNQDAIEEYDVEEAEDGEGEGTDTGDPGDDDKRDDHENDNGDGNGDGHGHDRNGEPGKTTQSFIANVKIWQEKYETAFGNQDEFWNVFGSHPNSYEKIEQVDKKDFSAILEALDKRFRELSEQKK